MPETGNSGRYHSYFIARPLHRRRNFYNPIGVKRWVVHIDMDAFFTSVEQKLNPHLKNKPIIVAGSLKSRSVVSSASYEAREYGIKSGMPIGEALSLCPHAIPVKLSNKYTEFLSKIVKKLETLTPYIEIASIDELFIEAGDLVKDFGEGVKGAERLVIHLGDMIEDEVELSSSIGIAPNKILAKMASEEDKPSGRTVLPYEYVSEFLKNRPVQDIPGIGDKMSGHLSILGIKTCDEMGNFSTEVLRKRFGILGERLKAIGLGRDDTPVIPYFAVDEARSVGNSQTLPKDTASFKIVKSLLYNLCENVARRLRKKNYKGRRIAFTIRFSNFKTISKSKTIKYPVDDEKIIYGTALQLLSNIKSHDKSVRMVGVSVSMLEVGIEQIPLFERDRHRRALLNSIDSLNKRYGKKTLTSAFTTLVGKAMWG
jgi:DNA polymerase-4